jgi:ATP-binding cassette subfamily B protein
VLLYGGQLAINGKVSVGALVAFNAYVVLLQAPFRFLSTIMLLGQRARASAQRIFEVLDTVATVQEQPGALELLEARGDVSFRDVHFAYGPDASEVLNGFSLRIDAGEVVALVGATGSGKSTVARLLDRFYDVTAGSVHLDGHDVRDLTLASLRHHVGIVTDEPFLFSDSVGANIAFTRPDAGRADIVAAAVVAEADGFVSELSNGYDTVVGERGYDLSGGQRQRLALARIVLAAPAVVVLDDATSAVDVAVEARIHAQLREALAGRTVILIAHRLSTIALADRVVVLEDGAVLAEGRHEHLLATEPRYRELLARVTEDDA